MAQDTATGARGSLTALHAVVAVEGPDATEFLHAQLTSDVKALAAGEGQLSAYLSPRGRVLATLVLLRRAGGYRLLVHPTLVSSLIDRLGLFVLRSQVSLSPRPGEVAVGAWAGDDAAGDADLSRLVEESGSPSALPWPGKRRFTIVSREQAPPGPKEFVDRWLNEDARQGLPWVQHATADRHVAQMLDLDRLGAVSFRKGCYPGQEIVARAHYLGRIKRRLARYRTRVPLAPATPLLDRADRGAGEVVYSAPDPEGALALAVVTTEAAAGDLHSEAGEPAQALGLAAATSDAV